MANRFLNLLVGTVALSAGLFIAGHHPLAYPLPLILFVAIAASGYYWPALWLVALPTLVPVVGLAPWSGWLTFEETDLLVLAFAAGGYCRAGITSHPIATTGLPKRLIALATLTGLALAIAMVRGFNDAGGFQFGWYQGYDGPMNSLGIGKSFFLALLMAPLLARQFAVSPEGTAARLASGLAGGLATASLAALWERMAFTDLLNFSSDYRTTGLFWEMHVGGAALDGWLLLTAPFAIWALRNAHGRRQWALAATLVALSAYACLTTFSRGVLIALPPALAILAWGLSRQSAASGETNPSGWKAAHWVAAVVLLAVAASLSFPTSGYRGLLALLGIVTLALPLPATIRGMSPGQILLGSVGGILLGGGLIPLGSIIAKGPYVLYTLLFCAGLGAAFIRLRRGTPGSAPALVGSFIGLCLLGPNVALHWGGSQALSDFVWALLFIAPPPLFAGAWRRIRWPDGLRAQGTTVVVTGAIFAVVATFGGGAYMEERFATSTKDLSGRLNHWKQTLSLLGTPDQILFGKGLGRFPANYFFAAPNSVFPGAYHLIETEQLNYLKLSGPNHPISFGDLFRISQRLPLATRGPYSATVTGRAPADATLHIEVCEKHLLYAARCQIGRIAFSGNRGDWETATVPLSGDPFPPADWLAPRLKMFSVGVATQGKTIEIAGVGLHGPDGSELLTNGDFRLGMARWFFSSDRDHMPWHAKNMFVNILFDQGLLGLALFTALIAAALWHLLIGSGRKAALAPYLAAGMVGPGIAGLFDSLFDVPRFALMFFLVALAALLPQAGQPAAGKRSRRPPPSGPGSR